MSFWNDYGIYITHIHSSISSCFGIDQTALINMFILKMDQITV